MNAIDALAQCVQRPEQLACYSTFATNKVFRWSGTGWQWWAGTSSRPHWRTVFYRAESALHNLVDHNGEPVEWIVVPVEKVETWRV